MNINRFCLLLFLGRPRSVHLHFPRGSANPTELRCRWERIPAPWRPFAPAPSDPQADPARSGVLGCPWRSRINWTTNLVSKHTPTTKEENLQILNSGRQDDVNKSQLRYWLKTFWKKTLLFSLLIWGKNEILEIVLGIFKWRTTLDFHVVFGH